MLLNKFFWLKVLAGTLILGVPAAVVGSYFAISNQDKFRNYYVAPSSDVTRGFIDAYKNAVYNGANVILAPGFTHRTPIIAAFQEYGNFFKDEGFLLYDETLLPQPGENGLVAGSTNVWNITYRSDLGSIQCGIALGVFLNQYQDVFLDDGKLTFATYGGLPFPSVTSFMGGLQKGIEWFNNNLDKLNQDPDSLNSIDGKYHINYLPIEQIIADSSSEFAGGFGPGEGATISENLISKNVDALMPVAGPQTWTAMNQIIKLNKKTILIGVDSPAEDDRINKPLNFKSIHGQVGNGKYVQFSSVKDLALSTVKALQIINNGNLAPENDDPNYFDGFVDSKTKVGGFGTVAVGTVNNNCVGVSETGKKYFDWILQKLSLPDPSLDPIYSEPQNMFYKSMNRNPANKKELDPSYASLQKEFKNIIEEYNLKALNLKGFIEKYKQSDSDKIKICLSTSTSILIDGSFSESCYRGLYEYYLMMGINIPNNKLNTLTSYIKYYFNNPLNNHEVKNGK